MLKGYAVGAYSSRLCSSSWIASWAAPSPISLARRIFRFAAKLQSFLVQDEAADFILLVASREDYNISLLWVNHKVGFHTLYLFFVWLIPISVNRHWHLTMIIMLSAYLIAFLSCPSISLNWIHSASNWSFTYGGRNWGTRQYLDYHSISHW